MKIANIRNQACVVLDGNRAYAISQESKGRFGPGMPEVLADWQSFIAWAADHQATETFSFTEEALGPVSPRPSQIFAIGLNYDEHSRETGLAVDKTFPPVFPKWSSSLAAPFAALALPRDASIDWEVELVAVIGRSGRNITRENALSHIAGYAIGQDFSNRPMQFIGSAPQFGLAKSHAGFSPVGPWIVTADELGDFKGRTIQCEVDGEVRQSGTLDQMIFSVSDIIAILSEIVALEPGDLIFTGTPSGVGYSRKPPLFLASGSEISSSIEGLGTIRQKITSVA